MPFILALSTLKMIKINFSKNQPKVEFLIFKKAKISFKVIFLLTDYPLLSQKLDEKTEQAKNRITLYLKNTTTINSNTE